MAEDTQIENTEADPVASGEEPHDSGDTTEEELPVSTAQESNTGNQTDTKQSNSRKRAKWPLILVIVFLIAVCAVGAYVFKPEWFKGSEVDFSSINSVNIEKDNLAEKELEPFFIPPSQDANSSMIRIDLSVIWDGLAAVRFHNKELQIRNNIYRYISKLPMKTEDLNTEVSQIETEMSIIFREALGVQNLTVMIREINYFK